MYSKVVRQCFLMLPIFLAFSAPGQAQRVSPDLLKLSERGDHHFHAFEDFQTMEISDGHVLIQAVAKNSSLKLMTKLQRKGLKEGMSANGIVSGRLPISSIRLLGNMQALKYVGAAEHRMTPAVPCAGGNTSRINRSGGSGTLQLVMLMDEDHTYEVEVVDMLGERILERMYSSNVHQIRTLQFDFSDLRSGWYFLRINDGQGDHRSYSFKKL